MAEASGSEPDTVEYPEGKWSASSVFHGAAVRQATLGLEHYFREREDVLVAMELRVYYERGNNKARLRPDVQVVFGVGREDRPTYMVWEEGKPPDFVLEVASPPTADSDAHHKAREFLRIGVREFWRLDPQGTIMGTPLEGYRRIGGGCRRVRPVELEEGVEYLPSEVLGLDMRTGTWNGATVLVFRDRRTGDEFRNAEDRAKAQANKHRAAEERLTIAKRDARAARREARAARDELILVKQRNRWLKQQIRDLKGRDSQS